MFVNQLMNSLSTTLLKISAYVAINKENLWIISIVL